MDSPLNQKPRLTEEPLSPPFGDFSLQPLRPGDRQDLSESAAHSLEIPKGWIPFYLTKAALLTFAGTFSSLAIVLAALLAYSSKNRGLSTANVNIFYLWTYGPTAALTCVAAIWAQVVYRIKQLMPWKAMADRPQTASKSILLDYVSPMSPVAMWKAVSNGHHIISLAILSSVVLTATTVVSTGLFSLQYVDITTDQVPLAIKNKFDWSSFDWQNLDARPTAVVYGTFLGLKYPDGTTAQYAVQNFTEVQGSDANLRATVDAFTAYIECEDANLQVINVSEYERVGSEYNGQFTFNFTSSTCTAAGVLFNTGPAYIFDALSPRNESHDITFGFARCSDCVEPGEHRILLSTGSMHVTEHWNGSEYGNIGPTLPWDQMLRINNSTNLLCTPHYRIAESEVVKNSNAVSGNVIESIDQSDGSEGEAVLAANLARGVFQSINNPIAAAQGFYPLGSSDLTLVDTFFTLMTQGYNASEKAASANDFWLQSENVRQYANIFYGSIAAQIAAQKLLTPLNATTFGSVTVNKPRLVVGVLSFSLMEVGLVMLALIAVRFAYCTSRSSVRHDPGSISGMASVLAGSPEFCKVVTGKTSSTTSTLESDLGKFMNYSRLESDKRMGIGLSRILVAVGRSVSKKDAQDPVRLRWWRPIVFNSVLRLLAVLTPLVYVVVLEMLFTTSQSRDGLTDVDLSSWTDYGWTYLPALAMLILQTLYISIAFHVRLLTPYVAMKVSPVQASTSVRDHPLSRIALHEAFVTARRKQFGVLAATIAALLAPLLTIAVSGLYTAENYHQDVAVKQLTAWNFVSTYIRNATLVQNAFDQLHEPNPTNYSDGYYIAPFTDLVVASNLSYPLFTFDEVAFPLIQLDSRETTSGNSSKPLNGTLELPISAIRGVLNCTAIPREDMDVSYAIYDAYPSAIYNETWEWAMAGNRQCLNFTPTTGFYPDNGFDLPLPGCRLAMFRPMSTYAPDNCTIAPLAVFLPSDGTDSQAFGFFMGQGYQAQHNSIHCPWYVGMLGSVTSEEIEEYTMFFCTTDVESVDTLTRFTLPNYSISMVQIDETSAKSVKSSAEIDLPSNQTQTTHHTDTVNVTGTNAAVYSRNLAQDPNGYLTYYNISSGQNYDNFFSALVYGRDGVPIDELIGPTNVGRLFSAIQHLWRIYVAQQFRTSEFIISADPNDIQNFAAPQPLNATYMDLNAYRLKQSEVSTRILQGILAALSLCAIIIFLLIENRAVLPYNPCSIAAVASLLVGSEMLDVLAAKQNNVDEQHKWDGYFFSLGWWSLCGGGKRFGIDIGKAEEATQPSRSGSMWAVLRRKKRQQVL